MNGEFSFDGKSCVEFGLHYVPDAEDRWYSSPEYKMIEEEVTGRNGGYWYGTKIGVRSFKLPCYFEDVSVERLESIYRWLSRTKEGRLVFDDRPFVYYIVRPVLPSSGQVWWHQIWHTQRDGGSGKITLNFNAYEPFGYMTYRSYDSVDTDGAGARCGIIESGMMPDAPDESTEEFLCYNPGSEEAYPTFKIAGSAPNGMTIRNATTGKSCTLLPFNLAANTWLEIDGKSGNMSIEPVGTSAFEYHADGYIGLASCNPYDRDIVVSRTSGSAQVLFQNLYLTEKDVGRYVYVENAWHRILYVHEGGRLAELDADMAETGVENTMVAVMNRIFIEGEDLALTSFEMDFTPMLR